MNKDIPEEHEEIVRLVCQDILSDETRSDHVRLSELAEHEKLNEEFDLIDAQRPRFLGRILSNADWAEKWSRGTYTIEGT